MDLVSLTELLVKELVTDAENVKVKEFPSENDDEIVIQVLVDEENIGRVIGTKGRIANSIRTIVQASSYLKDNKNVKINIDSF